MAELIDHGDEVGLIDLGRNVGHGANDLIQQRINVGHVLADGGVHVASQRQLGRAERLICFSTVGKNFGIDEVTGLL